MKAVFTTSRKRWPPKIVAQPLTNKLLLQLELLHLETQKSWLELIAFSSKVINVEQLQGLSLKSEIEAAVKECKLKAKGDKNYDTLKEHFEIDTSTAIINRNVGPHLLKCNIFRQHLLNLSLLGQIQ